MLLLFKFLSFVLIIGISNVFSLPVTKTKYDQSQHGELNVRADLDNILVLFVPSGGVRLLDNDQLTSILQIIGNSRRNHLSTSSSSSDIKDIPFNVNNEQAAIDKLHADIESLNSIIPIGKNYDKNNENSDKNAETKENVEETSPISTDKPEELVQVIKEKDISTAITTTTVESVPEVSSTIEVQPTSPEAKLSTSASPEITTSESIITSVTLTKASTIEKDKPSAQKIPTSDSSDAIYKKLNQQPVDLSTKLHQRVIGPSSAPVNPQVKSSTNEPSKTSIPLSPAAALPKSVSIEDDQQREEDRKIKSLQAGIRICATGQKLTQNGECVETDQTRESRQEKMDRLLSMLRFGVRPANENK